MRQPHLGLCSALLLFGGLLTSGPARAAAPLSPGPAPGPAPMGCSAANVLWKSVSNRIYVTGDVRCTLTDVRRLAPEDAPLTLVDPDNRIWFLGANLIIENGATLVLDGSGPDGDVAELRLQSNNSSAYGAFVEVRAQWGNLMIRSTRITSWDEHDNGPDTEYESFGRAFVRVVSYLEPDGSTVRQSRMDVIDSDIGYLGYYEAESYGLVWKVRDTTGPEVFETVDVVGDILRSKIHHNYFGMYSYGAYGMNITGNEVYENVMYGIDPHDDSDGLVVEDNYIHHNGNHGFICSKRCDGLTVRDNVSSFNAETGYMLHRGVENTIVEGNLAENNGDAGFAIMDSHDNILRGNTARGNLYGVRLSVGASDNVIQDNQLSANTMYGIYTYQGTDAPTINDGRPARNLFSNNDVSRSGNVGVRAGDAEENTFVGNTFAESGAYAVFLDDATSNVFQGNDLGGSYMLAQGISTNGVADTDFSDVMIGDTTASMTFTDSFGRVFQNNAGLATTVDVERSVLTLTHADHVGVVGVNALDFAVMPDAGSVRVTVLSWAKASRSFSTSAGSASNASFTLGGLEPGVRHGIWVDGVQVESVTADEFGDVQFDHEVSEAHTFAVMSKRRIRGATVRLGL
ncbi:MAG: right-handed parallel beta-helix repeat-containing protein [Pseudomonadota bacterium]|nr:right-handed parallel beta-helix repeat-containing protein [Pseudomonadota bacterium]